MFYAEVFSCLFFEGRSRETKQSLELFPTTLLKRKPKLSVIKRNKKAAVNALLGEVLAHNIKTYSNLRRKEIGPR